MVPGDGETRGLPKHQDHRIRLCHDSSPGGGRSLDAIAHRCDVRIDAGRQYPQLCKRRGANSNTLSYYGDEQIAPRLPMPPFKTSKAFDAPQRRSPQTKLDGLGLTNDPNRIPRSSLGSRPSLRREPRRIGGGEADLAQMGLRGEGTSRAAQRFLRFLVARIRTP